jgi:hypothetical protein
MRFPIIIIALLFLFACKNKSEVPKDPDTYYTCSMDPQVVEYKPGKCPICKMDLTPANTIRQYSDGYHSQWYYRRPIGFNCHIEL